MNEKRLVLASFKEQPDGSVEFSCDPAFKCKDCIQWSPERGDYKAKGWCNVLQKNDVPSDFACVQFMRRQ